MKGGKKEMKKLLKKKVNVFGKEISVLLIALVSIGLVSAALVPYLSGMITGLVTASSPMTMEISLTGTEGWQTEGELPLSTNAILGGGEITFYVRATNLADKEITGIVENLVTALPIDDIEISCNDFESVIATTTTNVETTGCTKVDGEELWTCGPYDLINDDEGLCRAHSDNTIEFGYGPNALSDNSVTFIGGQEEITEIVVTFELGAIGDYKFTSQVVVPTP